MQIWRWQLRYLAKILLRNFGRLPLLNDICLRNPTHIFGGCWDAGRSWRELTDAGGAEKRAIATGNCDSV